MIKKVFYNRVIKNYLLLFLTMFIVEIIFKAILKFPILDWSLFRIFIANNLIALVLSCIFSFAGNLVSNILTGITCFIVSGYAVLQAGFYNYLGVFISLGTRSQLPAVKDYINDYFESFLPTFYLMFIPFLLVVLYYAILERHICLGIKNEEITFSDKYNTVDYKKMEVDQTKKNKKSILKNHRINAVIVSLVLATIYYFSLSVSFMQNELQLKSNKELFLYPDMPNLAVVQFGVTSYGLIDVESTLLPRQPKDEFFSYTKPDPKPVTNLSRVIDDTAWESWDASISNKDYKKLNNYYLSKEITDKNDSTGIFKGKNLIVVMMESANTIVLDEKYYPNISRLAKEGWNFTNSYSPRNSCSTGNNEMSGMTSVYTINNTCTANTYARNTYPQSLFNLFNNSNYATSSYHNYGEQYYNRKLIHSRMGSGQFYNVTDLGIDYNPSIYREWPSDVDLMVKAVEKIDTTKPFMAWITTVTGHQPYNVSSTHADMYYDMTSDTGYDPVLRRYMSKMKVLDEAIGTLVDELDKKGVLEDTVIVLYGDHYPYGINGNILNQYFDYDVKVNNEVDRTPFIIYNPSLTNKTFDQYTSYMNIVPTLANLFDLEYDPRIYSGFDILSDDYSNRVVFSDGSWQDDVAFFNATTGKISYFGDKTYDKDYIIKINKEINASITMSNLAITSNYFESLFDGIDKFKIKDNTSSNVNNNEEIDPEDEER